MLGSTEKQDSSGHSNPGNSESKLCMPNALPTYMYMYTPGVVHVSICTMANVSRSMALPLHLNLLRISIMAMYAARGHNKLNEL